MEIAVVEVEPSKNTPVRLRGTVRVRVGPRRGIATRDEERVLTERRRSWDGPFDQRSIPGAKLDELDLELFRREYLPQAVHPDTLRENDRSLPQQLAGLHLASPDAVPNVAGMLLLGYEPTAFIKGAYVQFLRIDGTELTDPIIDRKELTGPLPRVLDQMDEVSRAHIRTSTSIAGTSRERNHPDYPIEALQQLLRNAVMHRNYESSNAPVQWYWFSDRVELHNPGLGACSAGPPRRASGAREATTTATRPSPLPCTSWATCSASASGYRCPRKHVGRTGTPSPSSISAWGASRSW